MKTFQGSPEANKLLYSMNKQIQDLLRWLPTIEVLCNKALKERHWARIKAVTGAENIDSDEITLRTILDLDISAVMSELVEISEKAKKQDRLEDMLNSMEKEWESLAFDLTKFRETSITIFSGAKIEEL